MKIAIDAIMGTVFLWFPAVVTLITEVLKRIPKIPTPEKSVKFWALGIAVVVTLVWYYATGDLEPDNAVQIAVHIVLNYTAAVGLYETFKNLIAKL